MTTDPAAVEQAIATVQHSRQTHVAWLEHIKSCNCQEWAGRTVGDAEHHRACIAGYDQVLAVLTDQLPKETP